VIVSVMLSTSLGVMPYFFLGAFGPDIQASLGLSEVWFGTIVAGYFVGTILFSFPAGHLGDVRGPIWTISVAALGVAASLTGIALARNGLQLALAVFVGGLANTFTQPGGNAALSRALPPERLGRAFALKQSSIPVAAMIAGLAVSTVGAGIGWRWTIALIALLGGLVLASARATPHGGDEPPREVIRRTSGSLRQLAPLAAAGACGSAATTGMVAFFVDSAIRGGVSKGTAGIWFAVGGVGGVVGRLLAGRIADRRFGRADIAWTLAVFWVLGAVGFILLALADSWPLRVLASFPTFIFGWGWNGMIHHATVQWNPSTPSWATGVTQTGMSIGGSIGPIVFGAVLGVASFRLAWVSSAAFMSLAALLVSLARPRTEASGGSLTGSAVSGS
jgi:MFS family permease